VSLADAPGAHLAFASLHLLWGHLGAAAVHRLRFGRNPLVLYRGGAAPHQRVTRVVSALSLGWAAALVASALSGPFRAALPGRALFEVPAAISWGVAAAGLAVMASGQISMGPAFRVGQDEGDAPPELREAGLHALSRNPIYVGSWAYLLGMTLWHPSALLLLLCAGVGLGIHGLVLAEERFLRARFGAAYEAYCRRTPRYLPGGRRG
jgi:protein-S-isoprenylcysteine O-methyltransferase Ste14